MSAGELRHYLVLESYSTSAGTAGDYSAGGSWSTVASVWASVKAQSGNEVEASRESTNQRYQIKIRHRSDVTNTMRFRDGSTYYQIKSNFDQTGRGKYLICECEVINA